MKNDLRKIQERYNQIKLTLPVKAGAVMVAFSKQRFRDQAWLGDISEPWKPRKAIKKGNRGRSILVKSGYLRRSIRVVRYGNMSVTIGSDAPYAHIHNEGFRGTVSVAAFKRKRFKKEMVETYALTKKGKQRKLTTVSVIGEIDVKAHTRNINMPRRRFMGASQYLNAQIGRVIGAEIMRIFK